MDIGIHAPDCDVLYSFPSAFMIISYFVFVIAVVPSVLE